MTPPETRVLYDLSALGPVAMHRANYTGVQRVVHEVACGLAARPGIALEFYAAGSLPECRQFVSEDPALQRCAFAHPPGELRRAAVARALLTTVRREPANRSLHRRAQRWAAHRAVEVLRGRPKVPRTSELRRFDLYHTPVHAFPASVRKARGLAKFLTVYDLTPVKMPKHSNAGILREFQVMAASVPEDAWFLCISENTRRDWCEYARVDPARCFVTPLAAASYFSACLDSARIAAVRQRYGIPEGEYFLSVSTLEPRKNLAAVIRAFQELLLETEDESLHLVLVGRRGWQEDGIFAAVDPAVRSRIVFPGYVAEEDLSALYSGALAFLYMSFYEGFGLPPLEAMQCGTPVITSNNSSLPEVVGSAGILLDPNDRENLCAWMNRLRTDASLREQLRSRSLAQARLFSWRSCVDRTVDAYQHALASR